MIRVFLILTLLCVFLAQTQTAQAQTVRTGQTAARVVADDQVNAQVFAKRMGDVSALALQSDGTVIVADKTNGRVFRIIDRALDGRADVTRALAHRFDRPTGLAVIDETLFVADRQGVWRVDTRGTVMRLASLLNAGSTGDPHPLAAAGPNSLRLGLTLTDGTTRLIDLDSQTGKAVLREKSVGTVLGFAATPRLDTPLSPWVLLGLDDETRFGATLQAARPLSVRTSALWVDPESGSVRVATPRGLQSARAAIGSVTTEDKVVLSGIHVSAMASDSRGLFVADPEGGRIWLLTPKADPAGVSPAPETELAPDLLPDLIVAPRPAPTSQPDLLLRGSGIKRASQLPEAEGPQPASASPDE